MPFSDTIKLKVKQKAAFRCCRCQQIGVQVHHIIPEAAGGPNTIENAAPLCPNCHTHFGPNPEKRKEIIQMREWWYEKCETMFSPLQPEFKLLDRINALVQEVQEERADVADLKAELRGYMESIIDTITPSTAQSGASVIVNASRPEAFPFCVPPTTPPPSTGEG